MPGFDFLLQNTPLYPLRFTPVYKNYIWGGTLFRDLFRRKLPDNSGNYAETWEVTDHPHGQSIIQNGSLKGYSLNTLVQQFPKLLFGCNLTEERQPDRFPLILKYLDAQNPLSVQIHPDDQLAEELRLESPGKTEFWIIVAAEPDASLWIGTVKECPKQEVENAIRSGVIQPLLQQIKVQAGDCFFLPPGTLHALGKGILVAEVQTSSDITFRVFDWNRTDKDGKKRELKIEEAIRALPEKCIPVIANSTVTSVSPNCEELVSDEHFIVRRWKLDEALRWSSDNCCHILTVLGGSVILRYECSKSVKEEKLCFGNSILIPAATPHLELIPVNEDAVILDAMPV